VPAVALIASEGHYFTDCDYGREFASVMGLLFRRRGSALSAALTIAEQQACHDDEDAPCRQLVRGGCRLGPHMLACRSLELQAPPWQNPARIASCSFRQEFDSFAVTFFSIASFGLG
jgi:hypothetical protein